MDDQRFEVFARGQYLQIRCAKHPDEYPRMQFIENHGAVALLKIDCPECGTTGPLKCDQFTISNDWTESLIAMGESSKLPKN